MTIKQLIQTKNILLDGGMGTLLQAKGLAAGEYPERWNLKHPEIIQDIHKAYFDAGSNMICTNTFGANTLKFSKSELREIVKAAIQNAKTALKNSCGKQEKFIALDIGPTGKLLKPYGDLAFEDAVNIFAETVRLGNEFGADLIFIETMNDSYETKAALLAAKENSALPVFVSNAYDESGKLMTGATPSAMIAMLEGLGADCIGVNCSLGPKALRPIVEQYLAYSSLPVLVKPNAGLPKSVNGKTVYNLSEQEFAEEIKEMMKAGVHLAGGCCGTTPSYIKALHDLTADLPPAPISQKNISMVSSYTHAVIFDQEPVLIGERINPTGKKRFKQALVEKDMDYILKEGVAQQDLGADILDVNVGLPEIDESQMLRDTVCELQSICNLPLQIDTADVGALETALRVYNGKAMINSVNGKTESMETIFPLAKKYGGMIVALTLDESGIPPTAEGRLQIAKKILQTASKYGIHKKDLIFDPLCMAISADDQAALETLKAIELIKNELGCHTSLGVSNVSFGLPERDRINSIFFVSALERGMSAAIMNPYSTNMMNAYHSWRALHGLDENCKAYITFAQDHPSSEEIPIQKEAEQFKEYASALQKSIIKGLKEDAAAQTKEILAERNPLEIVNQEIIPALNIVGDGFEKKTVYLPQLLMSAEAAKASFEIIKESTIASESSDSKCAIVLATVKGDIHDIGKNIVKLLLENYGYKIIDLGKDVPPQEILDAAIKFNAKYVGLSALMTTTVPAMEETIKLLRGKHPNCKILVGGAVLNQDYADMIGADFYAKDAMEAVRYLEK